SRLKWRREFGRSDATVLTLTSRKVFRQATVARKPLTGNLEVNRKAIAQARPGCSRRTCMLVCILFSANGTRDRGCSVHPVFPAPSDKEGGKLMTNLGRKASRECGGSLSRRCERSEAIHVSSCRAMDCFASLAI